MWRIPAVTRSLPAYQSGGSYRPEASDVPSREAAAAMSRLVYVTTDDCHFCERGRGVLDALGVARTEIAVDSAEAAALAEQGVPLSFLPVLTDGSRVVAYGRFSEKRLRKELGL